MPSTTEVVETNCAELVKLSLGLRSANVLAPSDILPSGANRLPFCAIMAPDTARLPPADNGIGTSVLDESKLGGALKLMVGNGFPVLSAFPRLLEMISKSTPLTG